MIVTAVLGFTSVLMLIYAVDFGGNRFGNNFAKFLIWQSGVVGSVFMLYLFSRALGVDLTATGFRAVFKTTLAICSIGSSYYAVKLYLEALTWKSN
ncbi:MAG: hypothetical protein GY759_17135 [Chloroflexi bacterium]|nr:hypothetical protein [Chloroflexota bacterium]